MPERRDRVTATPCRPNSRQTHPHATAILTANARAVGRRILQEHAVDDAQAIVLGAAFTAEYAVEGAALCNPSAVPILRRTGSRPGELRVAMSLRGIGEGHISAIEFVGGRHRRRRHMDVRRSIAETFVATISHGDWSADHFSRVLENEGHLSDHTSAVLGGLPDRFACSNWKAPYASLPEQLSAARRPPRAAETLREMAATAYHAEFATDSPLSGRVLMPVSPEENNGVEDARFVLFTHPDGRTEYRATFTAYNGLAIAPTIDHLG